MKAAMKAQYTPGPWAAGRKNISGLDHRVYAKDVILIADCDGQQGYTHALANARLIAAAPDLVFQLLSAANYIDALGGDSKSYRAAIARATGEPQ